MICTRTWSGSNRSVLKVSEQEKAAAQSTIADWDEFYMKYEAQVKEYTDYIATQDKEIEKLAAALGKGG